MFVYGSYRFFIKSQLNIIYIIFNKCCVDIESTELGNIGVKICFAEWGEILLPVSTIVQYYPFIKLLLLLLDITLT